MQNIDLTLSTPVHDSFRVQQVAGLFDLPIASRSEVRIAAALPGLDEPWTLGAIVGPSGSGKSSVAQAAFGEQGSVAAGALVGAAPWPREAAIVDGFPDDLDGRTITGMLSAVGFSSPPAWVRPYHVLSGGQRFRADLARALLLDQPIVAFDEFTSVVDRQVARFGSAAVARAIRAGRSRCRRFVAVTCHHDVLDWLTPDWVLDLSDGQLARGCLQRPDVVLEIIRCRRELWPRFAPHHYLSSKLHPSARCYGARWQGEIIGLCATMPLMGFCGRRIVHRLVVLPDYQGLGVGKALLATVAQHEADDGSVMSIVTSHPALIRSLAADRRWRCTRYTCCRKLQGVERRTGRGSAALRATASFRWVGDAQPRPHPEPQAALP